MIGTPPERRCIRHYAVSDAVDRRAKARLSARAPPILTRVISIVACSKHAKVSSPVHSLARVGRMQGKVERVNQSARRSALG